MKTLLLRLQLLLIDWHLATEKPLPAWLARACQNNPVLLSHYNHGRHLTHLLTSPAQVQPAAAPAPQLTAKIHRALSAEKQSSRHTAAARLSWLQLSLPLAAVAAVALFLLLRPTPAPDTTHAESVAALELLKQTPEFLAQNLPLEEVRASADSLAALHHEADALQADAHAAIRFLAHNFLPTPG